MPDTERKKLSLDKETVQKLRTTPGFKTKPTTGLSCNPISSDCICEP